MIENLTLVQADMSKDLQEKFNALFPSWYTVVATLIAVLILLLVLGKFVYKPVKKMVQDRRNFIQKNIDEAVSQNNSAAIDREQANKELIQARKDAAELLSQAKLQAEKVRTDNLELAKEEAIRIVTSAQADMVAEKAKFEADAKKAIVEVALAAAQQVVEKEVDNATNRKIIEEFVKSNKK